MFLKNKTGLFPPAEYCSNEKKTKQNNPAAHAKILCVYCISFHLGCIQSTGYGWVWASIQPILSLISLILCCCFFISFSLSRVFIVLMSIFWLLFCVLSAVRVCFFVSRNYFTFPEKKERNFFIFIYFLDFLFFFLRGEMATPFILTYIFLLQPKYVSRCNAIRVTIVMIKE